LSVILTIIQINHEVTITTSDSISAVGPQTTPDTLERHGKIAGRFSRELHKVYADLVGSKGPHVASKKDARRNEDFNALVEFLQEEKLTVVIPGRAHKTQDKLVREKRTVSKSKLSTKIEKLSVRLDRKRKIVVDTIH